MRRKRIIPLLDIKGGRVVKGVKFEDVRDVGDPLQMAEAYCKAGADELILLDIAATTDNRPLMLEVIRRIAGQVMIPLTVGGGVRTLEDFEMILDSGADRVAVNTAAIHQPDLLRQASRRFGGKAVVAAIDGEVTVKRLYRQRGEVWLMPENPAYSPIDAKDAYVVGRVTGLYRRF